MTFTLTKGKVLLMKGKITQTESQHSHKDTNSCHSGGIYTEHDTAGSDLCYTTDLTEPSQAFTAVGFVSFCTGDWETWGAAQSSPGVTVGIKPRSTQFLVWALNQVLLDVTRVLYLHIFVYGFFNYSKDATLKIARQLWD